MDRRKHDKTSTKVGLESSEKTAQQRLSRDRRRYADDIGAVLGNGREAEGVREGLSRVRNECRLWSTNTGKR
jgi:hypothetical protein